MAVPVVYSLAMAYPGVRITVLSRGFARPLFEDLAPNVSFMEANLKRDYRGIRGLNTLYRRLTAKNFTAIADLHGVLRSSYLRFRFNLANYHVEHIDKHRKERRQLTASRNKRTEPLPTAVERYAAVFAKLGYPIPEVQFRSVFPLERGNLNLLPAAVGPKNDGDIWIGVAPFAAHEGKIYPTERLFEVVKTLSTNHSRARFFLFGRGERERETFPQWIATIPRTTDVEVTLEFMQQELILMSHLDVMISMDSANMHLASIVGCPVVSIWGATHPKAGYMGWGQSEDNAVQLDMGCRPCSIYGNKACYRADFACMRDIQPEMIVKKVEAILDKD